MPRTLTVLTLIALTLAPLHADEVTITGRVVGPDGEPITGATVGIVKAFMPPFEWETGISAQDGTFEFTLEEAPPERATFVAARVEGYAAGGAMSRGGTAVEVKLSREIASLFGTVSDANGQPIEGARVEAMMFQQGEQRDIGGWFVDWEHAPAAQTDADGRFTLDALPSGAKIAISVSAEGYATRRDTNPDQWALAGQEEPLSYTLEHEAAISGRVTHEGEPVEGVGVRAVSQTERSVNWGLATTDAEGRYEIRDIGAGSYMVSVSQTGELVAEERKDIAVAAGERVEAIDFELTTGATVRGRVTWEDTGEPVAETMVGSVQAMGALSPASTDEDGRYELHLPPGEQRVQWMGDRDEVRGAAPMQRQLNLSADEVREGVDFVLQPKRRIEITVLGPDGEPAPGVTILWDASDRWSRPGASEPILTDENGRAEVLFGREVNEWDTAENAALAQDLEAGLAGMTIINGERDTEATIRLAEGAWALVTARTRDGEPFPGAQFQVRYAVGEERRRMIRELPLQAETGEDGQARIGPLPAGVPLGIVPTWEYQRRTLEPQEQGMPSTVFEPGETREFGPYVMMPDGFTMRGTVIDAEGETVEGAVVTSAYTIEGPEARVETDADGRFELTRLAVNQDTVVIIATTPDGSAAWVEYADPSIAFEPTIQLAPAATIVATFVGADGRPMSDLQVRISGNAVHISPSGELPGGLSTHVDARTDAEGRARFEKLLPGVEYYISWPVNEEENEWRSHEAITLFGDRDVYEVTVPVAE